MFTFSIQYIFYCPVEYDIVPHISLDNLQSPLDILMSEVREDDERILGHDQTRQGANGCPDQRAELAELTLSRSATRMSS